MPGQQQEKAFISQSGFYKESLCSGLLSSTTAITDANGSLTQHVLYFAYGETFVDEHRNSTNSPYLFNGKEYDEETGRYYYGARYYDPRISLWIGVDPLAGKYPDISPYIYCLNNPIILIDPDGRSVDGYTIDEDGKIDKVNSVGGDDYDVLYSKKEYDAGKLSNQVVIKDTKLLEELRYNVGFSSETPTGISDDLKKWFSSRRNYSYPNLRWSSSFDAESIAKVFWFASNNSNVEWDLGVYQRENGVEYALGTQQKKITSISFSRIAAKFSNDKKAISLHNHPKGNLLGASGYKNGLGDYGALLLSPQAKHYIYDLSTQSTFSYTKNSNYLNPNAVKDYKSILKLIK